MPKFIIVRFTEASEMWLRREFPTVSWGLRESAKRFPTQRDADRVARTLRRYGDVSVQKEPSASDPASRPNRLARG